MNWTTFFPGMLMALDFGASLVYASTGDYRRAIYWLAALVLTATVTL